MSENNYHIQPKAKDIGDNFVVRRSLPDVNKRMVGPFIFWDHMGPIELKTGVDMKVRAHPHIGLATITYLFSGEIMHRDSLGNEQAIKPGEVNWMTAGKGIVHSERAGGRDIAQTLEGIQLWLALPKEHEQVDASFYHCKEADLPLIEKEGLQLRIIAGEFENDKSPVPVYSDFFYAHASFEAEAQFQYKFKAHHEGAVYITEGEVEIAGKHYTRFDMVVFNPASEVLIKANLATKLMFFGGEIFPEKRHIWWNFVATSKEMIEQAKDDWRGGRFPSVINETEQIPLPEN